MLINLSFEPVERVRPSGLVSQIKVLEKYKKQKVISIIVCDGIRYKGQDEVKADLTGFYQKLFKKIEPEEAEDDYYDNCPSLSQQSQKNMNANLTLQVLLTALMTFMI